MRIPEHNVEAIWKLKEDIRVEQKEFKLKMEALARKKESAKKEHKERLKELKDSIKYWRKP